MFATGYQCCSGVSSRPAQMNRLLLVTYFVARRSRIRPFPSRPDQASFLLLVSTRMDVLVGGLIP